MTAAEFAVTFGELCERLQPVTVDDVELGDPVPAGLLLVRTVTRGSTGWTVGQVSEWSTGEFFAHDTATSTVATLDAAVGNIVDHHNKMVVELVGYLEACETTADEIYVCGVCGFEFPWELVETVETESQTYWHPGASAMVCPNCGDVIVD